MNILKKYLAFDNTIRLYVVEATELVQEIKEKQNSSRVATAAIGRTAIATVLIGALSNEDAKVYVRVEGGGPIGAIYADGDAFGHVRAYAQYPQVVLPPKPNGKLDVSGAVGSHGDLFVMKDYGLREMQKTQTQLVSGELGEDFAQYFAVSEQIPSAVGLGVLTDDTTVVKACGFIAQVLPGCPDDVITALENNLSKIPSILNYFLEHTIDEFADTLTNGTAKFLEEMTLSYQCSCSKDRFIRSFYALPNNELEEMVQDAHDEEIICEYCNKKYYITNKEIQEILDDKNTVE